MRTRQVLAPLVFAPLGLWLAACDDFRAPANAAHRPPPSVAAVAAAGAPKPANPAPVMTAPAPSIADAAVADGAQATPPASNDPQAKLIETSTPEAAPRARPSRPLLIKLEVLLDRAHFSPGEIDGQPGGNLRNAMAAFETSKGLPVEGTVRPLLLQTLESADPGPVTQDYVITAEDEKGPFLGVVPTGMEALAKLDHLGYATPIQGLAEKFHMSQALLRSLNPKADFTAVGTTIVVVQPGGPDLGAKVARVEVDKAANQVRAMDGAGKMLGVFPATVGSTERPAPSGEWAVKTVVHNPDYSYDPKRLTFGDKSIGKLRIAPGPNNPVGTTWIALTAETYGIHGTPDPSKIGKTASHGCVRLTNWDAATLGKAVTKGVPVVFVGATSKS